MSADVRDQPPTPVFVLLSDGRSVEVRPVDRADRAELLALHARASDESIYRRFFSTNRDAAQDFVEVICGPGARVWSLVAVHAGRVVGVATAFVAETGDSAEVAFLVEESLHGLGIGTVLLERLAALARHRGIVEFSAEVLTDNVPMLRVFHDVGFSLRQHQDHGVVSLEVDLSVDTDAVAAADRRRRRSSQRSLTPLLEPRSVAVVGVSRQPVGIGRAVLDNLMRAGFAGPVYAVGRRGLEVPGVTSLTRTAQLPTGVDLVVVALPEARAEAVVSAAAARGARACVVLATGRTGEPATRSLLGRRLATLAREHDMRLVGPDSYGVAGSLRGVRLDATYGRVEPLPGTLAVASQSGGVGVALLDAAGRRRTGLACFVSLGDKADLSGNDLLSAWTDDPAVGAAALYLESFHDPRGFARIAAGFSRAKPLLVVFGGSSAAGTRAGAAPGAGDPPVHAVQALFRAAGVVDVESVRDLVDTAALVTEQPLPRGPRLGIVGNCGGLGVVAADAAERHHLEVPPLAPETRSQLGTGAATASPVGTGNPVDLGAAATAADVAHAVQVLLDSGETDALLVVVAATAVTDLAGIAEAVEEAAATAPGVPCLTVVVGGDPGSRRRTTRFDSVEGAARSLGHAVRYARWRAAAHGTPIGGHVTTTVQDRADEDEDEVGHRAPGHWLEPSAAAALLAAAGVPLERAVPPATGPEIVVGMVRDPHFGPLVRVASGGGGLWEDQTFLMPPPSRADVREALSSLRRWPRPAGPPDGTPEVEGVVDLVVAVGLLALGHPEVLQLELDPVVVTADGPVCTEARVRSAGG